MKAGFLREKHIDSAEKGGCARMRWRFVQGQGQIEGYHDRVMALTAQFGDEGVVAETISTIHAARTRSDLNQIHVADRISWSGPTTSGGPRIAPENCRTSIAVDLAMRTARKWNPSARTTPSSWTSAIRCCFDRKPDGERARWAAD